MANAIIGSNGFIGSALKRYADKYLVDEEWIGITRESYDSWRDYPFNKIVWAAGTARKDLSNQELRELNYHGVVKATSFFDYKKFIYISSQAVYNVNYQWPSKEIDSVRYYPEGYGRSKYLGELETKRLPSWLIIRPNGFTGPGLKKNVIHSMAKQPPELYYSWDSRAQYIHVDHFAHILFKLASIFSNEIFNLTSPDPITPVDVASIMGVDIKAVKMPKDRIIPQVRAIVDTTKLEGALNAIGEPLPSSVEAVRYWNEPFKIPMPKMWKPVGRPSS